MKRTSIRWYVLICLTAVLAQGCTQEKAQAIKAAAAQFKVEATGAFEQIRAILKQAIEMPPQDVDKLATDLQQSSFNYDMLKALLEEGQLGASQAGAVDKQVDDLQTYYNSFAAMFESLPQGSFFAADAVQKSERHAINLTVQMIRLADMLDQNKIPVKLNAKRILLVEQIQQDNLIQDANVRREHLKNAAQQVVTLREEELKLKRQAIAQCLKAAQAGKVVASLIHDYRTLSVSEMLALTEQSLGFAAEITGSNADVVSALNRYKTVEATIRGDPYWSKLLDDKIEVSFH